MQNVNPDLQPYLKELEDRMKKPLNEQIEDLKIAGAKFLQSIDKIIESLDKFDPDQVTCSVDDKKVDCRIVSCHLKSDAMIYPQQESADVYDFSVSYTHLSFSHNRWLRFICLQRRLVAEPPIFWVWSLGSVCRLQGAESTVEWAKLIFPG